jgi:hypothetical protein
VTLRGTHVEQLDTVQETGYLRYKNEIARENYVMTSFYLAVYCKGDRITGGNVIRKYGIYASDEHFVQRSERKAALWLDWRVIITCFSKQCDRKLWIGFLWPGMKSAVHCCNKSLNLCKNIQRDATIISWFYFKISTCFGYLLYPSSGVQYCSWQTLVWIVKFMVATTLNVVQNGRLVTSVSLRWNWYESLVSEKMVPRSVCEGRKERRNGMLKKNCVMRNCTVCRPRRISLRWSLQGR